MSENFQERRAQAIRDKQKDDFEKVVKEYQSVRDDFLHTNPEGRSFRMIQKPILKLAPEYYTQFCSIIKKDGIAFNGYEDEITGFCCTEKTHGYQVFKIEPLNFIERIANKYGPHTANPIFDFILVFGIIIPLLCGCLVMVVEYSQYLYGFFHDTMLSLLFIGFH